MCSSAVIVSPRHSLWGTRENPQPAVVKVRLNKNGCCIPVGDIGSGCGGKTKTKKGIEAMNDTWETTIEDVKFVLGSYGIQLLEQQVRELLGRLDCDAIEQAALSGTEIDQQVSYAYEEIEKQLIGMGVLPKE